jgi:hypothetical protein
VSLCTLVYRRVSPSIYQCQLKGGRGLVSRTVAVSPARTLPAPSAWPALLSLNRPSSGPCCSALRPAVANLILVVTCRSLAGQLAASFCTYSGFLPSRVPVRRCWGKLAACYQVCCRRGRQLRLRPICGVVTSFCRAAEQSTAIGPSSPKLFATRPDPAGPAQ